MAALPEKVALMRSIGVASLPRHSFRKAVAFFDTARAESAALLKPASLCKVYAATMCSTISLALENIMQFRRIVA